MRRLFINLSTPSPLARQQRLRLYGLLGRPTTPQPPTTFFHTPPSYRRVYHMLPPRYTRHTPAPSPPPHPIFLSMNLLPLQPPSHVVTRTFCCHFFQHISVVCSSSGGFALHDAFFALFALSFSTSAFSSLYNGITENTRSTIIPEEGDGQPRSDSHRHWRTHFCSWAARRCHHTILHLPTLYFLPLLPASSPSSLLYMLFSSSYM